MLFLLLALITIEAHGTLLGQWIASNWAGGVNAWLNEVDNSIFATVQGTPTKVSMGIIGANTTDGIRLNPADGVGDWFSVSSGFMNNKAGFSVLALFTASTGSLNVAGTPTTEVSQPGLQAGPINGYIFGQAVDYGMAILGNGQARGWAGSNYQNDSPPDVFVDGDNMHVFAATRNGGGAAIKFFIDGSLIGTAPMPTNPLVTGFGFGHSTVSSENNYMNGMLGQLEFYDNTMSELEVLGKSEEWLGVVRVE